MRFIIGFIFFALLFYAIYIYFPDTFQTMVSWDAKVFETFRDLINRLFNAGSTPPATPPPATAPKALFLLMQWL